MLGQVNIGSAYIVRIHGRPPAVARLERIDGDTCVMRLRWGQSAWSWKMKRVAREHVVREATPREVAVAMVIHALAGEAA